MMKLTLTGEPLINEKLKQTNKNTERKNRWDNALSYIWKEKENLVNDKNKRSEKETEYNKIINI